MAMASEASPMAWQPVEQAAEGAMTRPQTWKNPARLAATLSYNFV